MQPDGVRLSVQVVAVLPEVPGIGAAPGVLADRGPALSAMGGVTGTDGADAANELWIATSDPAGIAASLRSRATGAVRILTPVAVSTGPITGATTALLAIGAGAAALLGVLGFLAASASDRAQSAGERQVLRSLGLSAARQRAARAGELVGVAVVAILGGAAAGLVVTAVVLPAMWGSGS